MPTSTTYLKPQDGWQQLVITPKFIRISVVPETHPFYVFKGLSMPTTDIGGLIHHSAYVENVEDSDTFYARVVSPLESGPVRIDTFWIDGKVVSTNHISLEDGSGFLALEDGTGLLTLET